MAALTPMTRPPLRSVLLITIALLVSGCVRFQPAVLYTGVEQTPPPERPRTLALAAEPIIFQEQNDDTVWFQDDERCTQGRVTSEIAHAGERAIEVSWNRSAEGCNWAGLGIGWDSWVGKDLSPLLPYAAIEMQVRTQKGTMYGLPIVLTLEDYGGGMGFAYTGNKYFERPFIDEEWQKVVVPLAAFDMEKENLDPTNVKQLMFELQQSGSIYLDDVRIIFYEEEEPEPWLVEAPRPDPTALPIQLFDDAFINNNGWGLVTDNCQSIKRTEANPASGSAALHLQWDVRPEGCYEGVMGVSWDRWHPIDITPIVSQAAIQLDVRLPSGTATRLPVRVGLEDYNRQLSQRLLDASFISSDQYTSEWQTVTIPIMALRGGGRELAASPATVGGALPDPSANNGADMSNIKHLVVFLDEHGEVFIDNLRLVNVR